MTLDEIENLWSSDVKMDNTRLHWESLRIPELHHKYYKIFIQEKLLYVKMENDYKAFYKLKHDYYSGRMDKRELEQMGWPPFQFVLKSDISIHLDGDVDLTERLLKLQLQKEKMKFVESIIDTLNTRGYLIKNAIDFLKWSNGG